MVERVDPRGRVGKEETAVTEQENTELVQRAYNHFLQGEIPALLDLLSEDVEWLIPGPESAPTAGSWHGHEQVGRFFEALSDSMEPRQFEPREFVAQGDKVVALGHYLWRVKATDGQWESDFAHLFNVRNGRVTRFQEFTDTDAFSRASGEG